MRYLFLALLLFFLLAADRGLAQDLGGDWNDADSWPCGCIPDASGARVPDSTSIFINGSVEAGVVYISRGAFLYVNASAGLVTNRISIDEGGTLVVYGTVTIQDDNVQGRPEAIGNSGLILNRGRILIEDVYGGNAIKNLGGIENTGIIDISRTGFMPAIANSGTFDNAGAMSIANAQNHAISSGGEFINQGALTIDDVGRDALFLAGGTFTNSNSLLVNNAGEVKIGLLDGASLMNEGLLQLYGTEGYLITCIRGGRLSLSEGAIAGTGTIRWCTPSVAGTISPGQSPGEVVFDSDVTLSGEYYWEVAGNEGIATPEGHDHIRVNGRLNFSGTVSINLIDGYVPVSGDRFKALTCTNGCNGDFSQLVAPNSNWSAEVIGNEVWLSYQDVAATNNNSLRFDGIDDAVLGAYNPALELSEGTIDLWVKPETSLRRQTFLCYRSDNGFQTRYLWNFLENLSGVGLWNGSTYTVIPYTFQPGAWYHLTFVAGAGENFRMYVDGQLAGTFGGGFGTASGLALRLVLGYDIPGGEYFAGEMDELRIWSTVRTEADILRDYDCRANTDQTCLEAYFPFDQGTADGNNPTEDELLDAVDATNNGMLINFDLAGSTSNWVSSSVVLAGACSCEPRPLTILQPTQDLDLDGLPDPLPFRYQAFTCQENKVFRAPDPQVNRTCGGDLTIASFIYINEDLTSNPLGPFSPNAFIIDPPDGNHQMMIVAEDDCQNRD
ncbi:MAG: LamG domain-containing protein, partial [Bacteroidota bacterium]